MQNRQHRDICDDCSVELAVTERRYHPTFTGTRWLCATCLRNRLLQHAVNLVQPK